MKSDELVIGIDSSTQSTKVIAWDKKGRLIAQGRAAIPMLKPQPNRFEQNPDDWWNSLLSSFKELWTKVDAINVVGVAVSNQRETVGFVDKQGKATRSSIVWLDERGRPYIKKLSNELTAEKLHAISGKPVDLTPVIYRLAWVCEHQPEVVEKTRYFVDVQSYLNFRLTGRMATSWSSADPMGWYDIEAKHYSELLLKHLGLDTERCPEALRPGTLIEKVGNAAAEQTGLRAGTPVFAGGGDGQCAAVGTLCTAPGNAYLNLGTALILGLWSEHCALSSKWRTMSSASGEGYVLEAVERTGAFLINWFVETFTGETQNANIFSELECEASNIAIGSDGLLTLPYWSGCMNPHWDSDARGCFIGLSSLHGRAHMYRSVLEGLTLVLTSALKAMASEGLRAEKIIAIGGGTESALWRKILADSMQRTIWISDTKEASSLGAGMIAAFGAGWFDSIEQAAQEMSGELKPIEANTNNADTYDALLNVHESVYQSNKHIFQKLKQFQPE